MNTIGLGELRIFNFIFQEWRNPADSVDYGDETRYRCFKCQSYNFYHECKNTALLSDHLVLLLNTKTILLTTK